MEQDIQGDFQSGKQCLCSYKDSKQTSGVIAGSLFLLVGGTAPKLKYILSDMPGSAFLEHPEYLDDYLPWNPIAQERCR